jgi:hypothetical protein
VRRGARIETVPGTAVRAAWPLPFALAATDPVFWLVPRAWRRPTPSLRRRSPSSPNCGRGGLGRHRFPGGGRRAARRAGDGLGGLVRHGGNLVVARAASWRCGRRWYAPQTTAPRADGQRAGGPYRATSAILPPVRVKGATQAGPAGTQDRAARR